MIIKNRTKWLLTIASLSSLFILTSFFTLNIFVNNISEQSFEREEEFGEIKLITSDYWNLTGDPIFINGSAIGPTAHNWTWFENQLWYGGGDGSYGNPYITI